MSASLATAAQSQEAPDEGESADEDPVSANGRDIVENFTCPVCMDLLIDPVQTNCDHFFCTFCLANWFHLRGRKNCPTCRADIDHLDAMPHIAAIVEEYVQRRYTAEQKSERNETRTSRTESRVMRDLGQNPVDVLLDQPVNHSNQFEFELPIVELDEDDFPVVVNRDRTYGSVSYSRRNSMINLYARAMFPTSDDIDSENDWLNPVETILNVDGPRPERYPSPISEINARLDDFEISLRESQMAYRYLMDGLTSLDPSGFYFEIIEERFRSLGLFPREGRLVSTYPSQEGTTDPHGIPRARSRRTPHPSDWYFIHHNRIQLDRDLLWPPQSEQHNQPEPQAQPRRQNRQSRRIARADAEMRHIMRAEGANANAAAAVGGIGPDVDPFESLRYVMNRSGGRARSGRRRRRHHRNRRYLIPDLQLPSNHVNLVDNAFPTFDRSLFGSLYHTTQSNPTHAERPYEQYVGNQAQYLPHPGNTVTTTAQNICVVHPDGSETWVDVDHCVENDHEYQGASYGSQNNEPNPRCEHRGGGSSRPIVSEMMRMSPIFQQAVEEEEREQALIRQSTYRFEYELVHHHGQPYGPQYHNGGRGA